MNIKITRQKAGPCQPPPHAPADYCAKLKYGINRLRDSLQHRYEQLFPDGREQIERAVAHAEAVAWTTPFPALFLSALVHLQVAEMYPQIVAASAPAFQS